MLEPGARRRVGFAALAAGAIVAALVVVAPVLWLAGALDEIEWQGDLLTGITVAVLIYAAMATGFIFARWCALLLVWLVTVAWIAIDQLRWDDNPRLSGMDDLSPSFLFPFTPLVMLLPAIGVLVARTVRHGCEGRKGASLRSPPT